MSEKKLNKNLIVWKNLSNFVKNRTNMNASFCKTILFLAIMIVAAAYGRAARPDNLYIFGYTNGDGSVDFSDKFTFQKDGDIWSCRDVTAYQNDDYAWIIIGTDYRQSSYKSGKTYDLGSIQRELPYLRITTTDQLIPTKQYCITSGVYDFFIDFSNESKPVFYIWNKTVREPADIYLLGTFGDSFDSDGYKFAKDGTTYKISGVEFDGSDNQFAIVTENGEDIWSESNYYVTDGPSNFTPSDNQPDSRQLTFYLGTNSRTNAAAIMSIPKGTYDFELDLATLPRLTVSCHTGGINTRLDGILVDREIESAYYTLNGALTNATEPGIYIRRTTHGSNLFIRR